MTQNPFTSSTFESIWSKHFNHNNALFAFDFIQQVTFFKDARSGVYINTGKNLTKGISYELNYDAEDYKGKTFLIYDVPTYFNVKDFNPPKHTGLKLKKIFQYQGFLMDISEYASHEDYINAQFSSKNRREFRSNQRRLETCFDVSYEFIHEAISKEKFDKVFQQFHDLLIDRFDEKQTNYHHLSPQKWNYYHELVFEMLKEKKASLLIISQSDVPIGITLNFHSETVLFETITVFDPDYYKFSIGKTSIIKLLEWCFDNNYRISDFSKGDFDYKHKWANTIYDFNYHVLYDSKSLIACFRAHIVIAYYKLKLFLRKKHVNEFYRKMKYLLSGQDHQHTSHDKVDFDVTYIKEFDKTLYESIDYKASADYFSPMYVYTFLFANPEPISKIKVFKHKEQHTYIISGSKKSQQITFKP
ncbi:GNAT family N-acetyltransferase [Psychroserpens sp. BH13MA-6]